MRLLVINIITQIENMARRKELKSTAAGLCGTFISRYNSQNGYWSIGQLCSLAIKNQTSLVKIDLLQQQLIPESDQFESMLNYYNTKTRYLLQRSKIPLSWLDQAIIVIEFNRATIDHDNRERFSWGNPYSCEVKLIDDRGKLYQYRMSGWCGPHNPKKESRSAPL